jgi:hypothetical protein
VIYAQYSIQHNFNEHMTTCFIIIIIIILFNLQVYQTKQKIIILFTINF